MKEKPILFSGEMVKAILDGRKTQTRRTVKPQPWCERLARQDGVAWSPHGKREVIKKPFFYNSNPSELGRQIEYLCPYGAPGDRLWVRETFCIRGYEVIYRATEPDQGCSHPEDMQNWTPSIFMKRPASRLTLEIVSVRVERLQDISEEDAKAEGVEPAVWNPTRELGFKNYTPGLESSGFNRQAAMCTDAVSSFQTLWQSINGADSWNANPWVWVIQFKRL